MTVRRAGTSIDLVMEADEGVPALHELLTAAGIDWAPATKARIGSVTMGPEDRIGQICPGSVIEVDPTGDPRPPGAVAELRVVAGLDAGISHRLPPGRSTIRAGDHPLRLEVDRSGAVTIWERWRRPGRIGGPRIAPGRVTVLGDVALCLSGPETEPVGPIGSGVTHHRPPRPPPPPAPRAVVLPEAPPPAEQPVRIGWSTVVAPVLMGGALALLFTPMMALLSILGPVMLLTQWVEERRRQRRRRLRQRDLATAELAELQRSLEQAREAEVERRRITAPDVAELALRARRLDPRLWERRAHDPDFLMLSAGSAAQRWAPPTSRGVGAPSPAVGDLLEEMARLPPVPVSVGLRPGEGLGVAGPSSATRAVARALIIQAATLHGPADLRLALLSAPQRHARWDWLKWLPHIREGDGATLAACHADEWPDLLRRIAGSGPDRPMTLLVVDTGAPLPESVRSVLTDREAGVAALVVAPSAEALPAMCASVIEVDRSGRGRCRRPGDEGSTDLLVWGATAELAESVARSLAPLTDPEANRGAGLLPERVRLLELLALDPPTPAGVIDRWNSTRALGGPCMTLGVTATGPLLVDLATDGPHGLVAGTTGSGKSELLRTMVASLAATADPEHLTFVLVDYKGGSAFDSCARFPHTVGVVTDLDERLAQRALVCLEAELRHRESRLREAGASDIVQFWRTSPPTPLPRLLVVIDEFAALAAELPDFMDALLDVAQRGRSLGVHLILATQRPGGVVSAGIRANTNLRIALRVQDPADSSDVIGSVEAATLGRRLPGRGYLRLGHSDRAMFQTALIGAAPPEERSGGVGRLSPFRLEPAEPTDEAPQGTGTTDLEMLAEALREAAVLMGAAPPRAPWPPPLPATVDLDHLWKLGSCGLADEPHAQRIVPFIHPPQVSLLLYGASGTGTSTALGSLALALAAGNDADRLHLYALDFDARLLAALEALPHTGAVVASGDRERQVRLLRFLTAELERRKAERASPPSPAGWPQIVVLLDGYAGFCAAFDAPSELVLLEGLARVIADGPGLGISFIVTADRAGAVPVSVAALIADRLVFRLADPLDYLSLGLRPPGGAVPPGRAIEARTGREVQFAMATGGLAQAAAQIASETPSPRSLPHPIGVLPCDVELSEVEGAARLVGCDWLLPMGIGDDTLAPVCIRVAEGESILVAGPHRSGRSSSLTALAVLVTGLRPDVRLTAVTPRSSPLSGVVGLDQVITRAPDVADAVAHIRAAEGESLLLIDDAELVDDPVGSLAALVADRLPGLRVVVAGLADELRARYGHWTQAVRRSRCGLVLQPDVELDGDLWHTTLPRSSGHHTFPTGRGFLVAGGGCELIQAARPIAGVSGPT